MPGAGAAAWTLVRICFPWFRSWCTHSWSSSATPGDEHYGVVPERGELARCYLFHGVRGVGRGPAGRQRASSSELRGGSTLAPRRRGAHPTLRTPENAFMCLASRDDDQAALGVESFPYETRDPAGRAFLFFFFSSRRRHTRWTGDWSSDVCSSDLRAGITEGLVRVAVGLESVRDL